MHTRLDIVSGTEYFSDLRRRFDDATSASRILLQTMSFDPAEPEIAAVMDSLHGAAERGASVILTVDAISFMIHDGKLGPLWWGRDLPAHVPAPFNRAYKILQDINALPNASAVIINRPRRAHTLHVAGRSHIKAAVIDDYAYIPCANLDHPDYTNLAIGFENERTADWLYSTLLNAARAGSVREALHMTDQTHHMDDGSEIFIDAGVRNQSLIHDQALSMIDAAQEWITLTCQYFPGGRMGQHLRGALKRDVNVEIIFSSPLHHHGIVRIGNFANLAAARLQFPAAMFANQVPREGTRMHAKLLACDAGLMMGSHNYVRQGVRLGTAEIAFKCNDVNLATNARDTLTSLVNL